MHNCRTAASVTFSLYLPCWLQMYFHVCYYLLIKGSCLALLQSVQFSTKLALHTHAGAGKSPLPEQLWIQRNISTNELQMNDQHHQHMTKRSLDSAQSLQTHLGEKNRVTTCYISPYTSFSSCSSAISRFFGFSNRRLFLWITVEGEFKIWLLKTASFLVFHNVQRTPA
jgi:hypothetical protein